MQKLNFHLAKQKRLISDSNLFAPFCGGRKKFRQNESPMHTQEIFSNTSVNNRRRSSGYFDLIFTFIQGMDAEAV